MRGQLRQVGYALLAAVSAAILAYVTLITGGLQQWITPRPLGAGPTLALMLFAVSGCVPPFKAAYLHPKTVRISRTSIGEVVFVLFMACVATVTAVIALQHLSPLDDPEPRVIPLVVGASSALAIALSGRIGAYLGRRNTSGRATPNGA